MCVYLELIRVNIAQRQPINPTQTILEKVQQFSNGVKLKKNGMVSKDIDDIMVHEWHTKNPWIMRKKKKIQSHHKKTET